jgi:hypothetical protein
MGHLINNTMNDINLIKHLVIFKESFQNFDILFRQFYSFFSLISILFSSTMSRYGIRKIHLFMVMVMIIWHLRISTYFTSGITWGIN